jgi:AraC-like DNA-binding protein
MKLVLCRGPEMLGGAWYTTATCSAFPLHVEEELELNLVVNGTVTVFANGERYRATRGDLVWLRPGYLHGLLERSSDMVMWVVSARARVVERVRVIDSNLGSGHAAELVHLGRGAFNALSKRCFGLLRAQREPARFNALLEEFLVEASMAVSKARTLSDELHRAVEQAGALLSTPCEPRWTLPRLAKRVGLNRYELSRLFHRQLGVTIVHYANHQRVQRFSRLYAERPNATTLRNALDAGFGSYSQFFRIFRAVTNLAPDHFRELIENGTVPKPHAFDTASSPAR